MRNISIFFLNIKNKGLYNTFRTHANITTVQTFHSGPSPHFHTPLIALILFPPPCCNVIKVLADHHCL